MGILSVLKKLVAGNAGSVLGGLGGNQLSAVATALIGVGGAKLPALVSGFQSAGLGHLVDTWIGKGANHAVTGEQVKSVVDPAAISEVATKLGVSEQEAATKVSGFLPELINKLTPNGSMPDSQTLAKTLSGLLK